MEDISTIIRLDNSINQIYDGNCPRCKETVRIALPSSFIDWESAYLEARKEHEETVNFWASRYEFLKKVFIDKYGTDEVTDVICNPSKYSKDNNLLSLQK